MGGGAALLDLLLAPRIDATGELSLEPIQSDRI